MKICDMSNEQYGLVEYQFWEYLDREFEKVFNKYRKMKFNNEIQNDLCFFKNEFMDQIGPKLFVNWLLFFKKIEKKLNLSYKLINFKDSKTEKLLVEHLNNCEKICRDFLAKNPKFLSKIENKYEYIINPLCKAFLDEELKNRFIFWFTKVEKINLKDYVWYVAYGSNMDLGRLECYITGRSYPFLGIPSTTPCHNTDMPINNFITTIDYELYFAGKSKTWGNKSTAFINLEKKKKNGTLATAYLITKEQFNELHKKEGPKYSKIVFLGQHKGLDMYTFTSPKTLPYSSEISDKYRKVILWGVCDNIVHLFPKNTEKFANNYIDRHLKNKG